VVAIRIVRSAARGAGRLLFGGGSTALEAPPSTALWHMRSYAGHRISELRRKKAAALGCESQ
jgi:hypothetical protein